MLIHADLDLQQGCGSGSAWIRIHLHSFYLLDPDPGGENLREKTEKSKENVRKL